MSSVKSVVFTIEVMDFSSDISLCANASRNNVTDTAWRLEGENRASGLVSAVLLILLLLIGLPWNLLVIVTIVKQGLYRQPTTILLLNLALSDILMLLLIVTLNTVTGLTGEFLYGTVTMLDVVFVKVITSLVEFSLIQHLLVLLCCHWTGSCSFISLFDTTKSSQPQELLLQSYFCGQ